MCTVCNHAERVEIESALLMGISHAQIAEYYNLDVTAVERHQQNCAMYTLSLDEFDKQVQGDLERVPRAARRDAPGTESESEPIVEKKPQKRNPSLQRTINMRETDALAYTLDEYLVTLKNLGRKINGIIGAIGTSPESTMLAKSALTDPMVKLYIGTGGEIRQVVKTMAEVNTALNTNDDSALAGLAALGNALRGSGANT